MEVVIVLLLIGYVCLHAHHARRKWRHYRHRSFLSRCWLSVPGPFGTRISRRLL